MFPQHPGPEATALLSFAWFHFGNVGRWSWRIVHPWSSTVPVCTSIVGLVVSPACQDSSSHSGWDIIGKRPRRIEISIGDPNPCKSLLQSNNSISDECFDHFKVENHETYLSIHSGCDTPPSVRRCSSDRKPPRIDRFSIRPCIGGSGSFSVGSLWWCSCTAAVAAHCRRWRRRETRKPCRWDNSVQTNIRRR